MEHIHHTVTLSLHWPPIRGFQNVPFYPTPCRSDWAATQLLKYGLVVDAKITEHPRDGDHCGNIQIRCHTISRSDTHCLQLRFREIDDPILRIVQRDVRCRALVVSVIVDRKKKKCKYSCDKNDRFILSGHGLFFFVNHTDCK